MASGGKRVLCVIPHVACETMSRRFVAAHAGWYWCLGPRQPNMFNTFVERPATDGRMLFWLAALYKVPGMLYYMTDDWSGLCNFRHVKNIQ